MKMFDRFRSTPLASIYAAPQGKFDVIVVGTEYYVRELRRLLGRRRRIDVYAMLSPDRANRYDQHAVRVDIDGAQVGYLSAARAKTLNANVSAHADGQPWVMEAHGQVERLEHPTVPYQVRLDIPQFWFNAA